MCVRSCSITYMMCAVRVSQDQLGGRGRRSNSIVADTGSDALVVDCTNARQFVIGSPHTIKLNQFFDKVRTCCIALRFEHRFLVHTHHHHHHIQWIVVVVDFEAHPLLHASLQVIEQRFFPKQSTSQVGCHGCTCVTICKDGATSPLLARSRRIH